MSRAQETQAFNTSSADQATNEAASQASDAATQAEIGAQQSQLAKFAAANPYVQGGQAQTVANQQLSGTADATAVGNSEVDTVGIDVADLPRRQRRVVA